MYSSKKSSTTSTTNQNINDRQITLAIISDAHKIQAKQTGQIIKQNLINKR